MEANIKNRIRPCPAIVFFLCVFLHILLSSALFAQDKPLKRAFVLHSYHRGLSWDDTIDSSIKSIFREGGLNVEIQTEYMDTKRIHDATYMKQLYELYRYKFKNRKFDVIISIDNHALNFFTEHRDEIFPGTPVIFCGVNNFQDSMLKGQNLYTGVVEDMEIKGTIDIALKLHPKTRQIIIYGTDTTTYFANKKVVKKLIPLYGGSVDFRFIEGLNIKEVQDNVRELSDDSIVLLIASMKDEKGQRILFRRFADRVDSVSHVPQYSLWGFILGHGIFGGKLISGLAQGEAAARMALRILNGEKIENIPVLKQSPNRFMFDYNQIKRFDIKLSDLPEESFVINRPHSFYANHKEIFWIGVTSISILLFIVLILGFNLKIRKKVEQKLKKYRNRLEQAVKERTSELKDSEMKLTSLIETVPIGIAISTPETKGNFTEINPALYRMFGYDSINDFLKIPVSSHYYHPQDRESFFKRCKQGPVIHYDTRFKRKDGSVFWGSVSSVPQTFSTGTFQFITIFEDITERKQMVEKLAKSEKLYKEAQSLAHIGHWIYNPCEESLFWSDELYSIFEINKDAGPLSIEGFLECLHPEDRDIIREQFEKRESYRSDYRIITDSGSLKHIHEKVLIVHQEDGEIVLMRGTAQDITERKQTEKALQNSQEIIRSFMEAATEGIVLYDKDLNLTDINPTALKIFPTGTTSESLTGKNILEMSPNLKAAGQYDEFKVVIETGEPLYFEDFVPDSVFGNKYLSLHAFKVAGGLGIIFSDITDKKQKEEKIKASLKEKEVLLQEIHHRVKNNMQVISSLLRIQASYIKDERVTNALLDCQGQVQAMALVHETLYGSDRLSVIDFKDYITRLTNKMITANIGSTDRIKLNVDAENIKFKIEQASPLGLIVNELLSNSLKYAFPKNQHGEIFVNVRVVEQDTIEFIYSDSGIGIPDDLDWRNTDSLGLQLIILLAEDQLDGTVNLNRDKGTRFIIKFKLIENK